MYEEILRGGRVEVRTMRKVLYLVNKRRKFTYKLTCAPATDFHLNRPLTCKMKVKNVSGPHHHNSNHSHLVMNKLQAPRHASKSPVTHKSQPDGTTFVRYANRSERSLKTSARSTFLRIIQRLILVTPCHSANHPTSLVSPEGLPVS